MYGLLSVSPGLAAAVLIYGLFATPADVSQQMHVFVVILGAEVNAAIEARRAEPQRVAGE